jgi:actin-related protein
MRKEMERNERERRKEEERLMRERIKEEERLQREQRREVERREKFLQRENERVSLENSAQLLFFGIFLLILLRLSNFCGKSSESENYLFVDMLKAEKKKQKDEIRREKDAIRRKLAIEKATARRIAKESMDLIEDEQLELMELAAISKGLPSVLQLDHDTLQNLEVYRDSLSTFPPKSLQLKMPFAISPWKDSDETVGNLLMVWRFLISFSDVLDLWPFTLDEFIQAFHDYVSRSLVPIACFLVFYSCFFHFIVRALYLIKILL